LLTLFLLLYVNGGDDYLVNLKVVSKTTKCRDFTVIFPFFKNAPLFCRFFYRDFFTALLTSNKLLNPHQSAYCKHHSTETALSYIHDYHINAIGSHKVSCLCLLDLSAAFDTIDHDILISHLSSWFGLHGSVLNWFKSYRLS